MRSVLHVTTGAFQVSLCHLVTLGLLRHLVKSARHVTELPNQSLQLQFAVALEQHREIFRHHRDKQRYPLQPLLEPRRHHDCQKGCHHLN